MTDTAAVSRPPDKSRRSMLALFAAFIGLLTFLVFSAGLRADFVFWDDDINVYDNPHIQGLTLENIRWMFLDVDQSLRYKPLSWLAWAAVFELNGLDPFGYHLANLLLHTLNAILVFFVLFALLSAGDSANPRLPTRGLVACALAALVWASHPLRAEPVAWVTALPYHLALAFMLVSLLCYIRAVHNVSRPAAYWTFYAFSIAAFVAALFSYPIVIGFVGVLLILDWYPLRRYDNGGLSLRNPAARKLLLEKAPFGLAALLFIGINLYGRLHPVEGWNVQAPTLAQFGIFDRLMQGCYVWANYLWRQWWPLDLSAFYPRLIQFSPTDWPFLASLAIVLGVTAFGYFQRRARPFVLALWLTYLVLLVPALGLTDRPHFASDRYGIVAGICWSVLLAVAVIYLGQNRARFAAGVGCLIAIVGTNQYLTSRQVAVWRDTTTLCRHAIHTLGESHYRALFHKRLATFYAKSGDSEAASKELSLAAEINPHLAASAYLVVGDIFHDTGRLPEAIEAYQNSLRFAGDNLRAHYELVILLAKTGRLADAEQRYSTLLTLSNGNIPARFGANLMEQLAAAYAKANRMQDASAKAAIAVQLAEKDPQATNLVQLAHKLKGYREAAGLSAPSP